MQGTAATACAGVYGALAVQGKPVGAIADQRFVIVGAGSAGMGVTTMLSLCLVKHVRPHVPVPPMLHRACNLVCTHGDCLETLLVLSLTPLVPSLRLLPPDVQASCQAQQIWIVPTMRSDAFGVVVKI